MKLAEEYRNQRIFRNWDSYIELLNISERDTILDFGCSIGDVTRLLAKRAFKVIGIDNNSEFLKEAGIYNSADNIDYINMDIGSTKYGELPIVDGIWSSFVASYFPNFAFILNKWLNILKPNGWIAITEINDLFAHEPLSQDIQNTFKEYNERQRKNNLYDFEMGSKLKNFIISCGLTIIHEENKYDKELTFNGPANNEILKSWKCRFDRMIRFKEFVGEDEFHRIRKEFLECLLNINHKSKTIVKYIIGNNNYAK